MTHDATSKLGVYGSRTDASGISIPTQTLAGSTTTNIAFALSYQEAASYCSARWYTGSSWPASPVGAQTNFNRLKTKGDAGTTYSWLRTIGSTVSSASVLENDGDVYYRFLSQATYVRPALWVKSDIIDNLP